MAHIFGWVRIRCVNKSKLKCTALFRSVSFSLLRWAPLLFPAIHFGNQIWSLITELHVCILLIKMWNPHIAATGSTVFPGENCSIILLLTAILCSWKVLSEISSYAVPIVHLIRFCTDTQRWNHQTCSEQQRFKRTSKKKMRIPKIRSSFGSTVWNIIVYPLFAFDVSIASISEIVLLDWWIAAMRTESKKK